MEVYSEVYSEVPFGTTEDKECTRVLDCLRKHLREMQLETDLPQIVNALDKLRIPTDAIHEITGHLLEGTDVRRRGTTRLDGDAAFTFLGGGKGGDDSECNFCLIS